MSKPEQLFDKIVDKYAKEIEKKKEELKALETKHKSIKMKKDKATILQERRLLAKNFSVLLSSPSEKQKKKLEDLKEVLQNFDKAFNLQQSDLTEYDLYF
jgi:Mg2+ and Co2+ transporter CorA